MEAKSSMSGLQDGEGPSRRITKVRNRKIGIRRTRTKIQVWEEGSNNDGSTERNDVPGHCLPFNLTNPEVLDCPICYEPLVPPIFQCENGHITCSSCCTKLNNKCASCSSSSVYRNRAVEKILESVIVTCQYSMYGCKVTMSYNKKHDHEQTCVYLPCSCPLPVCNFLGSSSQLYQHYSDKHKHSAVRFQYNNLVHVSLNVDDRFLILQEEKDGVLFILHNRTELLGNIIVVTCIATGSKTFFYDILARLGTSTTTLKFQSTSLCFRERLDDPFSGRGFDTSGFLIVPSNFVGPNRQLELDICIWRSVAIRDDLDICLFNRAVKIG